MNTTTDTLFEPITTATNSKRPRFLKSKKERPFMLSTVLLSFAIAGVMVANAATKGYHIHIAQDSVVEGKSIKAGDYTIEMQNNTAVIKQGKRLIEVPAHTESVTDKSPLTALEYTGSTLQAIRVGGSRTRIAFTVPTTPVPGVE